MAALRRMHKELRDLTQPDHLPKWLLSAEMGMSGLSIELVVAPLCSHCRSLRRDHVDPHPQCYCSLLPHKQPIRFVVHFPPDYPFKHHRFQLCSSIHSPFVNHEASLCECLWKDNWAPSRNISTSAEELIGHLCEPFGYLIEAYHAWQAIEPLLLSMTLLGSTDSASPLRHLRGRTHLLEIIWHKVRESVSRGGAMQRLVGSPQGQRIADSLEDLKAERAEAAREEERRATRRAVRKAAQGDAVAQGHLTVFVKTMLEVGTITFHGLSGEALVEDIKDAICEKEGMPIERQTLIFAGMRLEDEAPIDKYNITHESTLHLVTRYSAHGNRIPACGSGLCVLQREAHQELKDDFDAFCAAAAPLERTREGEGSLGSD